MLLPQLRSREPLRTPLGLSFVGAAGAPYVAPEGAAVDAQMISEFGVDGSGSYPSGPSPELSAVGGRRSPKGGAAVATGGKRWHVTVREDKREMRGCLSTPELLARFPPENNGGRTQGGPWRLGQLKTPPKGKAFSVHPRTGAYFKGSIPSQTPGRQSAPGPDQYVR